MFALDTHIATKVATRYEFALRSGEAEKDAVVSAIRSYCRLVPGATPLEACQAVLDIVDGWTNHLTVGEREETISLLLSVAPIDHARLH